MEVRSLKRVKRANATTSSDDRKVPCGPLLDGLFLIGLGTPMPFKTRS